MIPHYIFLWIKTRPNRPVEVGVSANVSSKRSSKQFIPTAKTFDLLQIQNNATRPEFQESEEAPILTPAASMTVLLVGLLWGVGGSKDLVAPRGFTWEAILLIPGHPAIPTPWPGHHVKGLLQLTIAKILGDLLARGDGHFFWPLPDIFLFGRVPTKQDDLCHALGFLSGSFLGV